MYDLISGTLVNHGFFNDLYYSQKDKYILYTYMSNSRILPEFE